MPTEPSVHIDPISPDLAAMRVLVVDDSLVGRSVIVALLKALGPGAIECAGEGEEALGIVAARRPDLVITDLIMPGMDGFELIRRLRADPRTRGVPILVQSALDVDERRAHILAAGATAIVRKPIVAADFVARLFELLERGESSTAAGSEPG